jgi:5-formyltetrahydrofolate cyclo-ligase
MAFYDKFFGEHQEKFGKMPTRYALALNQQLLDCVPIDNTDVRMDKIVHGSRVDFSSIS